MLEIFLVLYSFLYILWEIFSSRSNVLKTLNYEHTAILSFLRGLVKYDIMLRCPEIDRSDSLGTPTEPPGVLVNFGSLSPESRQHSIPRTSCFPNTLPSPTLLQISSAIGLSRDASGAD